MLFDELQKQYGMHIAKRVQHILTRSEFEKTTLENLPKFLEERAEKVALVYKSIMDNPIERGNVRSDILYTQWRDAEELSYLVAIAVDVSSTVRASMLSAHSS